MTTHPHGYRYEVTADGMRYGGSHWLVNRKTPAQAARFCADATNWPRRPSRIQVLDCETDKLYTYSYSQATDRLRRLKVEDAS